MLDYYADFTTEIDEEIAENVAVADEARGGVADDARAFWRMTLSSTSPSTLIPPEAGLRRWLQ